ncbi:L-carnitine dehydratase [Streptomyces viridosporus ATCC 14672]|uniref:L-carnitine dehydratase n=1 Tax=Streptomyces viridosporus (strain ATCC 14672 / DSM 40746 / JCM 4963 / KCTC 9882 / NRRL B-12104 / FH 1290) TaxID=566461 RepID=D6A949_STRV1|nr:L-carnitine dehydratase [Streptomyces viridosporus ATCC 14672]
MSGPLEGVLVADFSRVLAGPLCTMTLADLGATVVKVERPGSGDDTRRWGPPWSRTSTTYFESVNRSKLSVTLDLADGSDLALARELARRADVLVENFKPGTLERLGLGYDQVAAVNPGIVHCSVTGFGSGAGADLLGYDFVVQAVGGLMSITGDPDGEPTKAGVALVDVLTGKDAAIGVLAALADRDRTGRGCRVEVNLLSSLLGSLVNQAQGYLETGRAPGRMGNRHPSIAPYETLRCRDGLLAVACGNDGQFARLAAVLGAPGLADDERFATNAARVGHREELVAALEDRLAEQDCATWQERLTAAGVPAGKGRHRGRRVRPRRTPSGSPPPSLPPPGKARPRGNPPTYSTRLVRRAGTATGARRRRTPGFRTLAGPTPRPPPFPTPPTNERHPRDSDRQAPTPDRPARPGRHRRPPQPRGEGGALGRPPGLRLRGRPPHRAVVRGRRAARRPRTGQGTGRPRTAGHAPGGLRLRGHERGRLRPGLPGAGGQRLGHPLPGVRPGLAGDVRDMAARHRGAQAAVAAAHGGR